MTTITNNVPGVTPNVSRVTPNVSRMTPNVPKTTTNKDNMQDVTVLVQNIGGENADLLKIPASTLSKNTHFRLRLVFPDPSKK